MTQVTRRERARAFVQRQVREIRLGGLPVARRKGLMAAQTVAGLVVVLVARLLRPLVIIRFGRLPTDCIGPLALTLELYLCEREAGRHGRRVVELFFTNPPLCNQPLTTMWERAVTMSWVARPAERINRWLPGGACHAIPWGKVPADIYGLLPKTPARLSFTAEEERRGRAALRALGVPDGASFVCVHARESGYWQARDPEYEQGCGYRNSEIQAYRVMMEALVARGHVAIRMGAEVQKPLETANPRIIDYARTARSEFMDIFLCARARFYLGDSSGLNCVPMIFRRPIAVVNYVALEYLPFTADPRALLLVKTLWLRSERRLLTFPEILRAGIGRFYRTELYEQRGIEIMDNTPEEIAAVAIEMDERLAGTWQTTEDDEELQRRFWALFTAHHAYAAVRAHLNCQHLPNAQAAFFDATTRPRIGTQFLREHRELLEERTPSRTFVSVR